MNNYEDIKKQINFYNFNRGKEFYGKKSVHNVKGGKHIRITTYIQIHSLMPVFYGNFAVWEKRRIKWDLTR